MFLLNLFFKFVKILLIEFSAFPNPPFPSSSLPPSLHPIWCQLIPDYWAPLVSDLFFMEHCDDDNYEDYDENYNPSASILSHVLQLCNKKNICVYTWPWSLTHWLNDCHFWILTKLQKDKETKWQNDKITKKQNYKMTKMKNDKITKWQNNKKRQNDHNNKKTKRQKTETNKRV